MRRWRAFAPVRAALAIGLPVLGGCTAGPIGVASLSPDTLSAGLAGHWTFDENAGSTVGDSSGNGRDGTIAGGGWSFIPDGRFGGALYFSGTDAVTVAAFPQATPAFTVSAWLRLSASDLSSLPYPLGALLSNETSSGGWALYLQLATPVAPVPPTYLFSYYVGTDAAPAPNPATAPAGYAYADCACFVADTWVHLTSVVDADAGQATLYVGETRANQVSIPAGIPSGQPLLLMGRWPAQFGPPRSLVGALDDVAIWTRALVPEEIALLQKAPAPSPP